MDEGGTVTAGAEAAPGAEIERDTVSAFREAMNGSYRPKIGEGEYAYAKLEQLPKMLRDQAKDVFFFEAEPHVMIDAWNIVQMAADELESAISPSATPVAPTREEIAATLRATGGLHNPWDAETHADAILALLQRRAGE